jgi:RimJ/RimL family protein N-acetyltransferase
VTRHGDSAYRLLMIVRILDASDWQLKRDLRLEALQDSPASFGSSFAREKDRTEDEWRSWPRSGAYFAAFVEAQTALGIVGSWIDPDDPDTTNLISMWVRPEARRRGVSGLLIAAVIAWARQQKSARVALKVADGNEAALQAYLRNGFRVVDYKPADACSTLLELALQPEA